ncbi:hypothetical protein [Tautonia plasticadhaerens]|uniref:hypothetical protein n=1 Tax=Tautonia plasticadhaerens TaxID=2527974 RepID=UPI0011A49725|nr:hypothetical protein [Tautonia plasticadhaerens]
MLVLLSFGLGTLSQLGGPDSFEARGIEPWMRRRWVARMSSVLSLALVAAWASWGLFLLRRWARWLLTCVAALPIPLVAGGWVLLVGGFDPVLRGRIEAGGLVALSATSVVSCDLLYALLWSPRARTVFLPKSAGKSVVKDRERVGCSAIAGASGVALAVLLWFYVLLMTVLSTLVVLGMIRSA